jgi:hypothetical protein
MFRIEKVGENNRAGVLVSSFAAYTAAIVLGLTMVLGPSTALAAGPNGKPPTPQNFRVTARTAYTITLAWNAAPPNSGDFNYHLSGTGVTAVVLPRTATSHTFTALSPGNQYWFGIFARNAAGKTSSSAHTNTTTLLDTTPPTTAPVVSVNEVGSNYAALSWTPPQDDGPHFTYEISVNGSVHATTGRNITATVLRFLTPSTAYSITVRGRDGGHHWSPFSNPVSMTTLPPNPNDHTPPTTPTNVDAADYSSGDTEFQMSWTQSTDDFDRQENIRYDVYVNGVLEEILFGSSVISTIYGEFGENVIEVFATDTAGNRSAPATDTQFL